MTVEADQAIADGINASLARQLANDEPKCANCKEWHPAHDGASWGSCKILVISGTDGAVVFPYTTTDLSVCSAWTQK
jgi:hypothetical protein